MKDQKYADVYNQKVENEAKNKRVNLIVVMILVVNIVILFGNLGAHSEAKSDYERSTSSYEYMVEKHEKMLQALEE